MSGKTLKLIYNVDELNRNINNENEETIRKINNILKRINSKKYFQSDDIYFRLNFYSDFDINKRYEAQKIIHDEDIIQTKCKDCKKYNNYIKDCKANLSKLDSPKLNKNSRSLSFS